MKKRSVLSQLVSALLGILLIVAVAYILAWVLSHGIFSLWNMLESKGLLRETISWENSKTMAWSVFAIIVPYYFVAGLVGNLFRKENNSSKVNPTVTGNREEVEEFLRKWTTRKGGSQ